MEHTQVARAANVAGNVFPLLFIGFILLLVFKARVLR